jgi:hypothetical protein
MNSLSRQSSHCVHLGAEILANSAEVRRSGRNRQEKIQRRALGRTRVQKIGIEVQRKLETAEPETASTELIEVTTLGLRRELGSTAN